MIGSQIEDDQVLATRRAHNRKKLIMTEYLKLRKEAVQRLKD